MAFKARMGGSSTGSGGGLTPLPTTQDFSKSTTGSTTTTGDRTGTSATVQDQTTQSLDSVLLDKQNMTDQALQALQALIAGGGSNDLLDTQEAGKKKSQLQLEGMLAGLDPTKAGEMAAGQTADLTRKLMEQILPDIFGGAEAAGFGGDALSNLLAQDAAVRTGEAQARVEEDVRSNVQDQATQVSSVLNALLSSGSGSMDALIQALGISKGAVETGSIDTVGSQEVKGTSTTATQEADRQTSKSQEDATGSTSTVDPLGWAKLQAQLKALSANQPSRGEMALALFNASKSPFQSLADLSSTGNPNRTQFSGTYGSQDLMRTIQSFL